MGIEKVVAKIESEVTHISELTHVCVSSFCEYMREFFIYKQIIK